MVVARNWFGYSSFYVDITLMAQYSENLNTVVVRVDANDMEGWWYEGAGIYRHTWLVRRNSVHVITDGVNANPVRDTNGAWFVPVEVTLENSGRDQANAEVAVMLIGLNGMEVTQGKSCTVVTALARSVAKINIFVASPKFWSVADPPLYYARATVSSGGKTNDEVMTTCGFRTIRFDADKGFFEGLASWLGRQRDGHRKRTVNYCDTK